MADSWAELVNLFVAHLHVLKIQKLIRSEVTVDDHEYPISLGASVFKSWEDLKLKCELEWPKGKQRNKLKS